MAKKKVRRKKNEPVVAHHKRVLAKKSKKVKKAVVSKPVKAKPAAKVSKSKAVAAVSTEQMITPLDLERIVELDFVRTTEAAALHAYVSLGRGNAQQSHAAAVDAIRGTLDLTSVSGTVLFGDGLNPFSGGIQRDEKLGTWHKGTLQVMLGVIPIDGADLVASGKWGAMSLLVAARSDVKGSALLEPPCGYMHRIAYGRQVKSGPGQVHLGASVRDNLEIIAGKLGKRVRDLNVALLDRPENQVLTKDIRRAGASARLFADGDVACMLAPSLPNTGIDVYMGVGGSAETVMAAAAVKCIGGDVLAQLSPRDDKQKRQIVKEFGSDALICQYRAEDLAKGDNIIFCATGISDGSILRGVHVDGDTASTSSVVMRSRYCTVRKIHSTHDLSRKTVRLRSEGEAKL